MRLLNIWIVFNIVTGALQMKCFEVIAHPVGSRGINFLLVRPYVVHVCMFVHVWLSGRGIL